MSGAGERHKNDESVWNYTSSLGGQMKVVRLMYLVDQRVYTSIIAAAERSLHSFRLSSSPDRKSRLNELVVSRSFGV